MLNLHKANEIPPSVLFTHAGHRSMWVYLPKGLVRRPIEDLLLTAQLRRERSSSPHVCFEGPARAEAESAKNESAQPTATLFQDSFFFSKIKGVGDVPGTGRVYVEIVVEPNSGIAFAKAYSTKNSINAMDLLASRVAPFFNHHGIAIEEIHTPRTQEYCGLPPVHPFETFLATSHIRHNHWSITSEPCNAFCARFYAVVLREVLLPALRREFHLSLSALQNELDIFVEAHNAGRVDQFTQARPDPAQ